MTTFRPVLILAIAAATLAGCSGTQSGLAQSGPAQSALPQGRAHAASGSTGDLLYDAYGNDSGEIQIVTYPGGQPYGTVSNIGYVYGLCSDTSGNVYATTLEKDRVYEFTHGAIAPMRSMNVPTPAFPTSCSVDATTGNLAVLNTVGPAVDIWENAQGTPLSYPAPRGAWTLAYDNQGNLWLDGNGNNETLTLAELPKGASQFKRITLDRPTHWAGSVQWDGKYVAVLTNDRSRRVGERQLIYRIKVVGSKGTVVAAIPFRQMHAGSYFVIQSDTLIGLNKRGALASWHYPEGGLDFEKIAGFDQADPMTISVPPAP